MRPTPLDPDVFDELNQADGGALVTILLPTHTKGREIRQDPIRLKNLIGDVDRRLEEAGWRRSDREARLERVRRLLDDEGFWEHQSAALAVFVDEKGLVTTIGIPEPVDPLVCVGPSFHTRHLVRALGAPTLPVLALSKGGVRLYEADRSGIRRVDADLPESMDDVNWFMDREAHLGQHTDRSGASRMHHGHDPSDRSSEDVDRYLRAVARALPESARLAVLGDDALVSRFERIVGQHFDSPPNSGLADVDDTAGIHELVTPVLDRIERERGEASRELAATSLATGPSQTSIVDVLESAVAGRVSDLVIHDNAPPSWGRFDPSTLTVERHDDHQVGDVDLLDTIVRRSLGSGAEVRPVPEPVSGHDLVAVLRY